MYLSNTKTTKNKKYKSMIKNNIVNSNYFLLNKSQSKDKTSIK